MTLNDYVAALARELRVGPLRRRRILAEVEDHLQASIDECLTSGVARDEAAQTALDRFGPVEVLAAGFNRQWRLRTRLAAAAVLGGAGVLFVSVQRLMEGWVQPAPWPEDAAPSAVGWQSGAAEAFLLAAVVLALVALAGRRWSAAAAGVALVAVALAAAFVSHYDVERAALVAGSPTNWELAGVCVLRAAALLPAALLLVGRLRVPRVLLT